MSFRLVVGRTAWVTLGSVLGFLLVTLAVFIRFSPMFTRDAIVSHEAYVWAIDHPTWLSAMLAITNGGRTDIAVSLVGFALLILVGRGNWIAVRFIVGTVVGSTAIRLAVLAVIARPRPVDQLDPIGNWAYPSGHTTWSALLSLAVFIAGKDLLARQWQHIILVIGCLTYAILVGISRVALVVHWPSDVIGAWLLVSGVALVTASLTGYGPSLRPHRLPA